MGSETLYVPLGDICDLKAGNGFPKKHQGLTSGDVPFIKVSDFSLPQNERMIAEANNWVDRKTLEKLRATAFPADSVVFAKIGVALQANRRRLLTQPTAIDNNLMAAIPDLRQVDPLYLYYALLQVDFNIVSAGTALPYLNARDLNKLAIPLPPLSEQRAIAGVLGSLDDKIELNRRMNRTLESMARALFRHRFLDHPDPAWEEVELGDMITIERETVKVADHPDETFDHFSLPAFDAGQQPIRELGGAIKSNKFAVPEDAVLISRLNPRIPRVWMPSLSEHARSICSTEFLVCRPGEGITREWLYCFLTGRSFTKRFQGMVTGTTGSHQRVSAKAVPKMSAVRPTAEAVTAFTEVVASLMEQIRLNIAESETLSALRDTLLPRLLSGALRPPADRGDFEPAEATVRG